MGETVNNIERWKADPVTFIEEVLVDPSTGKHIRLYHEEKVYIRIAFTFNPDGTLKYPELLFSAPKKSGKTGFAAMFVLYIVIVWGGPYAEAVLYANDLEQSTSRVFAACCKIIKTSPELSGSADVQREKIIFPESGSTIIAVASDFAGSAGGNPTISVFDELWGYTSESALRLWDESAVPPTRKVACRLTVTYAGFEGESVLLEGLYKRAMKGKQIAPDLYEAGSLLAYWTHDLKAPWQTPAWVENMRENSRPNAFLRHVENRWTGAAESFVDMEWWDACLDQAGHPILSDPSLSVWLGVDASVKRDSAAIVGCSFDEGSKKVRMVYHRIFQPSPTDPLDFETTIEETILLLRQRFNIRAVRYDPYQMAATSQRLAKQGLPMVEFPQSVPNLTAASTNLYELLKGRNMILYPDAEVRLSASRAVAIETTRGWRIAKEKASHKIDVIVALAQAALGAVTEGQRGSINLDSIVLGPSRQEVLNRWTLAQEYDRPVAGWDI